MRVTILHNPDAGDAHPSAEELTKIIRAASFEADYQSLKEDGWIDALRQPVDFVVAAGGDGTVRKVAKKLLGRSVPIALLPLGTANNIAGAVGLVDLSISEVIDSWAQARRIRFDVGVVTTSSDQNVFLESVGFGLLTKLIADAPDSIEAKENQDERIEAAIEVTEDLLAMLSPQKLELKLDGHNLLDDYLMAEVMNICCAGPNLRLAANADPSDRWLDVVLVSTSEKDRLHDYLKARRQHAVFQPSFRHQRAKTIELVWNGCAFHIDDEIWPNRKHKVRPEPMRIQITCHPEQLEFLLPARKT